MIRAQRKVMISRITVLHIASCHNSLLIPSVMKWRLLLLSLRNMPVNRQSFPPTLYQCQPNYVWQHLSRVYLWRRMWGLGILSFSWWTSKANEPKCKGRTHLPAPWLWGKWSNRGSSGFNHPYTEAERLPIRHGERTLQEEGHQISEESDIYWRGPSFPPHQIGR